MPEVYGFYSVRFFQTKAKWSKDKETFCRQYCQFIEVSGQLQVLIVLYEYICLINAMY